MTLFYELMQVALGNRVVLSETLSEAEWHSLYENCLRQSVTGFAFEALDGLSKQGQKPPTDLLYQWIGDAEQIKARNLLLNKRCVQVSRMFAEAGFRTCILKGQGNARLYPNPLSRTSGDIDIWVDADKTKIDEFVHRRFPDVKGGRMHIEFPVFDDVPVEVHYFPRYMFAPRHDMCIQAFFQEKADGQFGNMVTLEGTEGTCAVTTVEFSLVQQMSHLMGHFMGEGIGLRQFVDYYYLLTNYSAGDTSTIDVFRKCGLLKFAQGVMWVEKELLGLEDKFLIVEPSERIGRAIQQTIEEGGNFGHHNRLNVMRHQSMFGRAVGGMRQSLRAMQYFPVEASWKMISKIM